MYCYLLFLWRKLPPAMPAICAVMVMLASPVLQARESINLAWALQQTLANNLELATYPMQRARAEALKLQAGVRPVPVLALAIENALGSGEFNQLDSSETTLTLSQTIELGAKRQQRVEVANAGIIRQETEYELSRLDVLAETSRRYYQLLAIQARQKVIERRIVDERQALKTIRDRAGAGAIDQADVAKMDLRLARSLAAQQQQLELHRLAKTRLAAMWQAEADFNKVSGNLDQLPTLASSLSIVEVVNQAPAVMRQLALQRLADAQLQLSAANGAANLSVGLGIRQLEASNDQALTLSFSMPLAFKNPNRGRIAAARANLQLNQAQADLNRRNLTLSLLELHQQLGSYKSRAEFLQQRVLPKAKTLLTATRVGYRQGRYGVLQWADAQAELFSLRLELIDIHHQAYLQLLELERISGHVMTGGNAGESL